MTGSNIFSFASTKRKPKSVRDNISDPLSAAKLRYIETKAADNASRSTQCARGRQAERPMTAQPIVANINDFDANSQHSLSTSASPECLRKQSTRPELAATSRTRSSPHRDLLKKEQSSSTLRSHYDRKKLPLAVSQQTSDSSARDFALRKGCPPVIPSLPPDVSCPPKPHFIPQATREAPAEKRPSRFDFSMLFPKPLPRQDPLLSPQRYTDSPPPLSATSEMPSIGLQSHSFVHGKRVNAAQEQPALHPTRLSSRKTRKFEPKFAKTNMQKSRGGVQNWFDGLQGNISEDDDHNEPDMQPAFLENAFQTTSDRAPLETAPQPTIGSSKIVCPVHGPDHQSSIDGKGLFSPELEPPKGNQLRDALHEWQVTKRNSSVVDQSLRSGSTLLDTADLHEQSVLCLSSSDDEDENMHEVNHHQINEKRAPFLRDSLGIDSIDSDVEIGTAQAVNTSFMRTHKPPIQSNHLREISLVSTNSKVQKLQAVEIPDRRSSRQAAPRYKYSTVPCTLDDGAPEAPLPDLGECRSVTSKRSTRKAQRVVPGQSTLLMALTPQEASLLKAMRSKRASMRYSTQLEVHQVKGDKDSKSFSTYQPSGSHDCGSEYTDSIPVSLNANSLGLKKSCLPKLVWKEPNLPSGRGSLIFSESVSSPTTGRASPPTPTLESNQVFHDFHRLDQYNDPRLHTVKMNDLGPTRCRPESNQLIVLENFQPSDKESVCPDGYPWMISQFNHRNDSPMIH
ncbi:hypothetical protein GJ744_003436 [Endocarpon pusillum]|uniref:Uncharacterized protein n=1 Tax=Endocarpon pusillum TaxID=364733 RepID=A0A8H7A9W2_9EURO|nr:hypothetical protein GJ744_003436 [Endocarpon pusillum]